MRQWGDSDRRARLRTGEACVICRQGGPSNILVELETSWVTVNNPGDPFEGGPIDPKAVTPAHAPGEIVTGRECFRSTLGDEGAIVQVTE